MTVNQSYEKHENWYVDIEKHLKRIMVKDTVDYWRHDRMYKFLEPFYKEKIYNWLTIGDGIGTDAN